jgi:hypothetical protein
VKDASAGSADKVEGKVRLVRLAERTHPKRVRFLLEGLQERTVCFESSLAFLFDEVEQRLFKQADCARSNEEQARLFEAIREIKRGRADIVPRFLAHVESSLALLDQNPSPVAIEPTRKDRNPTKLELVDSRDLEIALAMQDIANRAEIRHSISLHMLGHRLGVIAGRAVFEPSDMPLGPLALTRALQHALGDFDLELQDRLRIFHDFDGVVMAQIDSFYDKLNQYLAEQGVLPNLHFQVRRGAGAEAGAAGKAATSATEGRAEPSTESQAAAGNGSASAASGVAGHGGMPAAARASAQPRMASSHAEASPAGAADGGGDAHLFSALRGLLAERRHALNLAPATPSAGYMASREDLQSVLGELQAAPIETIQQNGRAVSRNIGHLKQDLLNQLRTRSPNGQAALLAEEDSDTIDLVGMLFDYIGQNLSSHSSSRDLIAKLQVPVLRSAISDKQFFTQRNHPARQLLNSVAEASTLWMGEDDADRGMVDTMTSMVDRVTREFNGDLTLMESLLDDLGRYMSQVTRRAEIAERRHIDAAKGRERLDLAREQANSAIGRLMRRGKPAPMVRAVLEQAWTDVLALTLLRQGEESQAYRRCLAVADQLMQIGSGKDLAKVDTTVREEVRNGLLQVGLHGEEVEGVLSKLFDPGAVEKKTSHTELAHTLKSKTRLGGEAAPVEKRARAADVAGADKGLTAEEKEMVQRIRTLPFGTWFEFVINQQGAAVRRKLAWFSTVTGRCLFVNQRGARAEEKSIEQLARDLVRGQVRLHKEEPGNFIDRAWKTIMSKLQQLSGQAGLPASA